MTWADVGALGDVRQELMVSIVLPIQHPDYFERIGLRMPAGVLLYGPPGCGKTLLAKVSGILEVVAEQMASMIWFTIATCVICTWLSLEIGHRERKQGKLHLCQGAGAP